MKYKLVFCALCVLFGSCEGSAEKSKTKSRKNPVGKSELIASIQSLQDSLNTFNNVFYEDASTLSKNERIALETNISVSRQELINRNRNYYILFPNDSLSVHCLMNLYHLYDGVQAYKQAISYLDTIELNYPDFAISIPVMESKAVSLDFFIEPRDTSKIRVAYERLLALPKLSIEKQKMYIDRLSNLDKGLEEIIP